MAIKLKELLFFCSVVAAYALIDFRFLLSRRAGRATSHWY